MILLGFALNLAIQGDQRQEIDLPRGSGAPVMVASPDEYWIGARHGHLYASRNGGRSWRKVDVPVEEGDSRGGQGGDDLGRVRFFDSRIGILPVAVRGSEKKLLRTEDGGLTWDFISMPGDMLVNDSCVSPSGLAWMVGLAADIYFSEDFGRKWRVIAGPLEDVTYSRSVHFESRNRGVVGGEHNALYLTEDACRTWRRIATPLDESATPEELAAPGGSILVINPDDSLEFVELPPGPSAPITKVRLLGERLILFQGVAAYVRRVVVDEPWGELQFREATVVDFELHPRGVAVLTSDGIVAVLDKHLEPIWFTHRPLESMPSPMASGGLSVAGERVLVFDGYALLHEIGEGEVRSSRLLLDEDAHSWNITALDRAADGTMWGVGPQSLYFSRTDASTWTRAAYLPTRVRRVLIQESGDVFLLGRGEAYRWIVNEHVFEPVPAFERLSILGIERHGDLWLAYGARYTDEENLRERMGSDHSVFAGDFATGVVLASTDGGQTWRVIEEWEGGRVEALFLTPASRLVIYRIAAGVRAGELRWESGSDVRAELKPAVDPGIEIQYGPMLVFYDEDRGKLSGGQFYGGSPEYMTVDGGRTWVKGTEGKIGEPTEMFRLGGGALVARVRTGYGLGKDHSPDYLVVLRDSGFEKLKEFGRSFQWVQVDAAGRLLLELEEGEIWSLSADATTWSMIRGKQ